MMMETRPNFMYGDIAPDEINGRASYLDLLDRANELGYATVGEALDVLPNKASDLDRPELAYYMSDGTRVANC